MSTLDLYSEIYTSLIMLNTLISREKYCFGAVPKATATERWITESVW